MTSKKKTQMYLIKHKYFDRLPFVGIKCNWQANCAEFCDAAQSIIMQIYIKRGAFVLKQ